MRIDRVRIKNSLLGWELQETHFSQLTLLVGVSGVGKTRILDSLNALRDIARGHMAVNGLRWEIEFRTDPSQTYVWSGEYETMFGVPPSLEIKEDVRTPIPVLKHETLVSGGLEVLSREREQARFRGQPTYKLIPHESALSLLREEEEIRPVRAGFLRVLPSWMDADPLSLATFPAEVLDQVKKRQYDVDGLIESQIIVFIKLCLLPEISPKAFSRIKREFIQVFPQVEDLDIALEEGTSSEPSIGVRLKERGVDRWITQRFISAGMFKVLMHLAEIHLSPSGTVFLIDEFENSLGVNCIDTLTEDISMNIGAAQYIITSHHPYVINNIGMEHWKIVTREGGVVRTREAAELGLGKSHHEAFLQLMNKLDREVEPAR